MEQNLKNYDLGLNVKILKTNAGSVKKSHKCNQCDYASFHTGHLRTHLKTHSGEKSNICNQCDYATSQAGHLRRHLKRHSGEKPNKCNQCDFASLQEGYLRRKIKVMQSMCLCLLFNKFFVEAYEETQTSVE